MAEIQTVSVDVVRSATVQALKERVSEEDINKLLDAKDSAKTPAPLGATASLTFVAVWGVVKCEPATQPWIYDEQVWGIGAAAIQAGGFMYTAYDSWDAFFRETAGFHVQGIASGGGIFQINWFNSSGVPVGQFNGVAGGISAFEAGGKGKWKRK